jgi:hypothetical protein
MKTDSQKHYEDLEAKIKLCRLRLRGNQNLKQCDSLKGELEALLKQKRQGLKQKREGLIRSQGSLVSAPKQCEALPQIPEQKPEEPCQAEPQGEFDEKRYTKIKREECGSSEEQDPNQLPDFDNTGAEGDLEDLFRPKVEVNPGEFVLRLGKYKGLPLRKIPKNYLWWLLDWDDLFPETQGVIEDWLGITQAKLEAAQQGEDKTRQVVRV